MSYHLAMQAYTQNQIQIESPKKLIEMLYEGILRFNSLAIKQIEVSNIEKKVYYINRSNAIFTELINSLNLDLEGSVGPYLYGLYNYQIKLLNQANINNHTQNIHTVNNVVKGLLEAWRE